MNLDLVCKSQKDLTPIIQNFGGQVDVLCNEKTDFGFYVVLEPEYFEPESRNPETHARHFIELINNLPVGLREIWDKCGSKTFDFGFRSGFGVQALISEISHCTLEGIVSIGASVDISIYPVEESPNQRIKADEK